MEPAAAVIQPCHLACVSVSTLSPWLGLGEPYLASCVFYEALTVRNPKVAGEFGDPRAHPVKLKVMVLLPDLTLGAPVEVKTTCR